VGGRKPRLLRVIPDVQRSERERDAEPLEPRRRQHQRVHLSRIQLAQPRVDVTAQLRHLEIGPHSE
jgi:hypothetical protein